jgi:hypothetical protein
MPGQEMQINLGCSVTHGGPANVTLVDTTTGGKGTVLGGILKSFTDFCPRGKAAPADRKLPGVIEKSAVIPF